MELFCWRNRKKQYNPIGTPNGSCILFIYVYLVYMYIFLNTHLFVYKYLCNCSYKHILDVPPPSSSHQQHILTFWLGDSPSLSTVNGKGASQYKHTKKKLFLRCTYYVHTIYSTYCRCIGYIYIYIHTVCISYIYIHISTSNPSPSSFQSWPNKFVPVTSRPSSVFFLENPWGNPKFDIHQPCVRKLLMNYW